MYILALLWYIPMNSEHSYTPNILFIFTAAQRQKSIKTKTKMFFFCHTLAALSLCQNETIFLVFA